MTDIDWVIQKMLAEPGTIPDIMTALRVTDIRDEVKRKLFFDIIAFKEVVAVYDNDGKPVLDKQGNPKMETRITPTYQDIVESDVSLADFISEINTRNVVSLKELINVVIPRIKEDNRKGIINDACAVALSSEGSSEEIAVELKTEINRALMTNNEAAPWETSAEVEEQVHEIMQERIDGVQKDLIPTGFKSLDVLLNGGLTLGEFVVFMGDTGDGKSSALTHTYMNILTRDIPVAVISLEMSSTENRFREISCYGKMNRLYGVNSYCLRNPNSENFNMDNYIAINGELRNKPIHYLRSKRVDYEDLESIYEMAVDKYGAKVIVLDHILLVSSKGRDEERIRLGKVADLSKKFAAERNVIVMAASQQQRRKEGEAANKNSVFGSAHIENAATCMITIEPRRHEELNIPSFMKPSGDMDVQQDPIRKFRILKRRGSPSYGFTVNYFYRGSSFFEEILPNNFSSYLPDSKGNVKLYPDSDNFEFDWEEIAIKARN